MNQDRQIRFLYPPILILTFLAWAALEDPELRPKLLVFLYMSDSLKGLETLVASSTTILIVGFVCGTSTFLMLRLIFGISGRRTHEIPISNDLRLKIWNAVNPTLALENKNVLFATAYLHFGVCPKEVAEWIARRWNAFNLSANICFGLAIVMAVVGWSSWINPASYYWFSVGAGIISLFFVNAIFAWKETMGMLSFCAKVPSTTLKVKDNKD